MLFGYPYDWIKEQKKLIIKNQFILFGVIFLVSVLIILIWLIKYSTYLNRLSHAVIKLSNRESYENININTRDELELLAESFNTMSTELNILHNNMEKEIAHKTKELQSLNENLEERVKEELQHNREKDKQLIQQSRMAMMGEMIRMIAHQWRQPLAAISATSASIELKAGLNKLDNDVAIQKAQDISNFSQHLSKTIDDFRNFFKQNKEKGETTYSEVISSVFGIIEISLINKNIQLQQELNCHEQFSTYPNELKQVVLNLIKNAEDVLLERSIKDPSIKITTYTNENNYILEVSDNAGGISEDIIKKIFDPYFSTKTKKDGTGLGLYMSKTIIEEHCGGELSVSNSEDGAVFKIVLHKIHEEKET
jgi:C4-dicarboxylate-specific signal transduction histidine kinase